MLPHKALPNLEELFNQLIHCRHIVTVYIFGGTSTAVSSHKALPNLEELPNQLIHCWNVIFARSSPALSLSCTAVHKLLDEHCRQVASTAITLLLLLYLIWKLFSINSHSHYSQSGTNGSVKYVIVDGVGSYPFRSPNRSSISHSPGSSTSAPLGLTPLPTLTSGAVQGVHNGIVGSVSRPPPSFFTQQMIKMLMVMRRLHSFAWPCHSRCNKTIKLGVEETRLQLKYQSSYLLKIHFPLGLRPTSHCQ